MYKSCDDYEIFNNIINIPFNTTLNCACEIINKHTKETDVYLEIGIETGFTYKNTHFINKTGVDPDPKCEYENILKLTSDEYFEKYTDSKDVIFIDGMHQVEYIVNDINNSINIINDNGIIFIDDILPINYFEQLKIPFNHYYENNIIKYREPWTGDVWKVIYFILINFSDSINFRYFTHKNFRGILLLKVNKKFKIDIEYIDKINSFEYTRDFKNYISILNKISN
jgi:hypothetical protein